MALLDVNWNPRRRELQLFAALQTLFFGLVAYLVWRRTGNASAAIAVISVSAAVAVLGLLVPTWMRGIYVVWMAVTLPIGWVVSHLVMAAVYYGVVTPIALTMRLTGRSPIARQFDPHASSYWVERPPEPPGERYFRQF